MGFINKTKQVDQELIEEYFRRNERKKEDEKWLKEHRKLIVEELKKQNKDIVDYGNIRVSVIVPNTSYFDKKKVMEFVEMRGIKSEVTKEELDEDRLVLLIEQGVIDVEELKEYAWVESTGTPRVIIKELDR